MQFTVIISHPKAAREPHLAVATVNDDFDDEDVEIRAELAKLRQEHRDLDAAILALEESGGDRLQIQRLKKRKLVLRDKMVQLEDQLTPDIIA